MIAALRLVLFHNNVLHPIVLSPGVTWLLLVGAVAGFLRLMVDLASLLVGALYRQQLAEARAQPPPDDVRE